ncbi:MAG: hypothetical protein LQ346_005264 [Caloplaca aetnensis]|nr:MAG: hypothetical protein LQ346_005264 [Caloplaca aetnensis]
MRLRMQTRTLTPLLLLLHLTSHLCTSQSIGRRINQFSPQWHCNVDSFEFTRTDRNDCDKAIDSNDNTFWHSRYTPSDSALPHRITIDMGKVYNTRSMTYLPRQDGDSNGNIGTWRISLSVDDGEGTFRVLNGSWKDDATRKTVDFLFATPARYLRLDALTEAGGRGPWSSAAQIDIYEDNGSDDRNPPSRANASPSRNISLSTITATSRQTPAPFPVYGNSTTATRTFTASTTVTATATTSLSTQTGSQPLLANSSGDSISGGRPSYAMIAGSPGRMIITTIIDRTRRVLAIGKLRDGSRIAAVTGLVGQGATPTDVG